MKGFDDVISKVAFCQSESKKNFKQLRGSLNKTRIPRVAQTVKTLPAMQETRVWSLGWKDPLEKGMAFLPGEPHGQRGLAGCSPWSHKESDMTEQLAYTNEKRRGKTLSLSFVSQCLTQLNRRELIQSVISNRCGALRIRLLLLEWNYWHIFYFNKKKIVLMSLFARQE